MSSIHTPILTYHRIIPENSSFGNPDIFSISACQFEQQMYYLHKNGYTCLSIAEVLQHSESRQERQRRTFAITFDDGFEDFFTIAYPILRAYHFTATVFLVTDKIHSQNDADCAMINRHLTWKQIDSLQQSGISFGSHTCTHPILLNLSHDEIWHEFIVSKESLEAKLGYVIQWLAYPHGITSIELQRMTESAGYKAAFGTHHGKSGPFNIWRRLCFRDDTLMAFANKLTPWYHYLRRFREETGPGRFLRNVKSRMGF